MIAFLWIAAIVLLTMFIDVMTGWVSPILGPAVMLGAVIGLGYLILKAARR